MNVSRPTFLLLTFALFPLGAVGCGGPDPEEASKANFRRVLDAHFAGAGKCVVREFPEETDDISVKYRTASYGKYLAFVAGGLAEITEGGEAVGAEHTMTFRLTAKGDSAISRKRRFSGRPVFCFGKKQVAEITGFTEPSVPAGAGAKVSRVGYTYEYSGVPEWLAEPISVEDVPGLPEWAAAKFESYQEQRPKKWRKSTSWNVGGTEEGRDVLVRSGDGWVHRSAFSRQ